MAPRTAASSYFTSEELKNIRASNSAERTDTELSGKTKGRGICFYINSGWCNDVTVIQQHCSPDLESFIINCKPFYSPCEFASFILVGVYIPPQANVQDAQRMLADQILCVERTNPDYLVIVLGDFNKGNLTHDLPKYRQVIKCPTRGEKILDQCYTTVRDAYHAVPRAALGHSDHVMVHLIPAYRQKLKLCKPVVRTSRKWTSEAVEVLQACLDSTDWDVFRNATNSLNEYTEAVTSYISFCEDCCVPSRTRVSYNNNNKPWFTAKLRRLSLDKEEAFRSGDKDKFKEAKYKFSKGVREAKQLYSAKLQHQFSANDTASDLYTSRTLRRAGKIVADPSHPGHKLFETLPSGRRLRSIRTKTSRHKNTAERIAASYNKAQRNSADDPIFLPGDFNKCIVSIHLPNLEQYVTCPTRMDKILDQCFGNIEGAYVSICRPPLGRSDHNVIHLLPKYRQKLKREKPVVKHIQTWMKDSIEELRGCFEATEWDLFFSDQVSCNNPDLLNDTITSYLNFCADNVVDTKEVRIYPNNKPWVNKSFKHILNQKKIAFKQGDRQKVKDLKKELRCMTRKAKMD
ncbi:hypothetical protein N1851_013929 [Merluccius polli]|uniref:Endonuclease/exonuclease/phosphatase domain-containing protein n=1 Tax=Merluccius polli TaxID=89951 RepID=A0AA47P4T9_MERPO|nr:hypothetical protein N1851_013929 [Merluccius polli]